MDVTLPNGTTINGVPDGTTKAQLAAKLTANGMDVPAEWMAPAALPTPPEASVFSKGADDTRDASGKRTSILADLGFALDSTSNKIGAVAERVGNFLFPSDDAATQAANEQHATALGHAGIEQQPTRLPGQFAGGLLYAPLLGAAPIVAGAAEGNSRYDELIAKGVDPATARQLAEVHGALNAGAQMIHLPGVGGATTGAVLKSVGKAAATGAAVGGGQEITDDLAESGLLGQSGYDDLSKEYAPTADKVAEAAAFMAGAHTGAAGIKAAAARAAAVPAPKVDAPPAIDPATGQPIPVSDQLRIAAGDKPIGTPIQEATARANEQRGQAAQKLETSITDSSVSLDDTIAAANDLISRPATDVFIRADALKAQAEQNARNKALQEQLDSMGKVGLDENGVVAPGAEMEQARLAKLQEAIDQHAELLNQHVAPDVVTAQLGEFGNRTDTARPDVRSPQEIASATADPILKQLFMNRIREDAGMTPGADALKSEASNITAPEGPVRPQIPGLTPEGGRRSLEQSPQYPDAPRGLNPENWGEDNTGQFADLKPMDFHEAMNRLDVMHALREKDGTPVHAPNSLSIGPHPEAPGKYAIARDQAPSDAHDYSPELQGNKQPAPPSTDPVDLYVAAQRATNTPAARHFVGEYDAGRYTREDVQRAMIEAKRSADTVDQNMTSSGNVLERAGRDSVPMNKPRGESPLRDSVVSDGFATTKQEGLVPPETLPPEEKLSDEEMKARLPYADDNHTLKTAVRETRSVGDAAEHLAKSQNPIIAKVGELARGLVGKTKFIPWPTEARLGRMGKTSDGEPFSSRRVGGFYDPNSDEVSMREQRALKSGTVASTEGNERIVAHELTHAITSWAFHNPTPEQLPHVKALNDLFVHVRRELKGEGHYGLTNIHEFLSEAFSSPEFQVRLSKIKYGTTTAWSQFVHSVAKLLGFKESNALTEVLSLGEKLANEPRREGLTRQADIMADVHPSADSARAHELDTQVDPRFKFARNLEQAVRHAANTSGEFGKALADLVTPYIKNTSFTVVGKGDTGLPPIVERDLQDARGLFWKSISKGHDGVWVKGADYGAEHGVNNETVLHEALHAATARKVRLGEEPIAKGSLLGGHVRELDRLRGHVIDQYNQARQAGTLHPSLAADGRIGDEAFGSNTEFVTYGLTHKPVQEFLKSIPGLYNRSAFGDFVARVRGILGMDAKHTSALADLIDLTHRVTATSADAKTRAAELEAAARGDAHRAGLGQNPEHAQDIRPSESRTGDADQVRVDRLPRGLAPGEGRPGSGPVVHAAGDAARSGADAVGQDQTPVHGAGRGEAAAAGAEEPGVPGSGRAGDGGRVAADPALDAASRPLSPEAQRGAGAPAARAASSAVTVGGRTLDSIKSFGDKLGFASIVNDIQARTMPMSDPTGSDRARADAKAYSNQNRLAQAQWMRFDDILTRNYSKAQRTRMYDAGDEENLIRGGHEPAHPDKGLASLPDDQRATMETLHNYAEAMVARAQGVGMLPDGPLPFWTPRMAVMIGENGEISLPPDRAGTVGVDVTTSASSGKARKHLRIEDTEAGAKALLDKGDKTAIVVRDIRAMPLAMARLERAIAGRELVESIRRASTDAGFNAVSDHPADGFFTLNHPAFKTFMPVTKPDINGKMVTVLHEQPLYIRNEYKGPLQSIMYDPGEPWYRGLMAIKREATSLIMYSPTIHNEVIFGKALAAVNFNPYTLVRLYNKGRVLRTGEAGGYGDAAVNLAKRTGQALAGVPYEQRSKLPQTGDYSVMREAIGEGGMAPIGNFGAKQDITGIAEDHALAPGQGWKSQILGNTAGVLARPFGESASVKTGDAVKVGIDAFGHFWHNTLLWHRVADLQIGLYAHIKEQQIAKLTKAGLAPDAANAAAIKIAGHWANRYAGALPNEAMSAATRKWANLSLFSRSFTLGNLAIYKDAVRGLPADIRSQLQVQFGSDVASVANKSARRKAGGTLMLEMGALYVMNSLLQDAMTSYRHKDDDHGFWSNMADQMVKYGPRAVAALQAAREHPVDNLVPGLGHPFKWLHSFTSNGANEPGKEARIRGYDMADGTATYFRSPIGKVGEDLEGWMSDFRHTAWSKVGSLVKPAVEIAGNRDSNDHQLWAPSDSALTALGKAAMHFMAAQAPVNDVQAIASLMQSSPNRNESPKEQEQEAMKKRKLILPILTGVTISKGYPGGPTLGAAAQASRDTASERAYVLPQVHQLLQTGDPADKDKALELMRGLHMAPPEMLRYLKGQLAPASRLSAGRMANLARTNPEGYAELQRVREAQ